MYLEEFLDHVDISNRDKFDETMHNIMTVEVGVKRGMMLKAPALPKWGDVKDGMKQAEDDGEPELWWKVADQSVKGKEDGS